MVDEESQEVASEQARGAPVNRDSRPDPGVIDGEIASSGVPEHPAAAEPDASLSDRQPAPAVRGSGAFRAFLAGALGGALIAALAALAGYLFFWPSTNLAEADASRLAALEAQARTQATEAQRQASALAGLDKRFGALEAADPAGALAALDKRVSALDAANAANAPKIAAALEAAQGSASELKELKELKAEADAARSAFPELSARVAKLEANESAPQAAAVGHEISDLASRVGKVEAALAAPKTESRVAPEEAAFDNSAAVAIVAAALRDKLAQGAPFGTELSALQNLGIEPEKLAPLKALANGGPTNGALAAAFATVAPKALAAASSGEKGDAWNRFLGHIRGMVQVRDLNEASGDDPVALVSQIEAGSRRGDLGAALAAFARLPEPARRAASAWAAEAGAKQQAEQALQSIRTSVIEKLAAGGKS